MTMFTRVCSFFVGLPHPVAIAALGLVACASDKPRDAPQASVSVASSASQAEAEVPQFGPWWDKAAATDDELDIAELARREGALALVAGLDHATFANAARAALPLTTDARLALPALADRVHQSGSAADAETLLAVVRAPSVIGERLDPEGESRAAALLLEVANDNGRERRVRALAVSALRLLAEQGVGDVKVIPSDLDEAD